MTGVADANMDRAPVVAIAGQAATTCMHKESHQLLDLVEIFRPIANYATQLREAAIIPEVIRKAFTVAQRFGATGLTFFDDEVAGFFSPHASGKSVMFLVALGNLDRAALGLAS